MGMPRLRRHLVHAGSILNLAFIENAAWKLTNVGMHAILYTENESKQFNTSAKIERTSKDGQRLGTAFEAVQRVIGCNYSDMPERVRPNFRMKRKFIPPATRQWGEVVVGLQPIHTEQSCTSKV